MKTILVLAPTPALAEAISSFLAPQAYRVLHRISAAEAEPLLKNRFIDFCILDAEGSDVRALWEIEKVREWAPDCPIIVFKGVAPWEFEEEAYLRGVASILSKPVRERLVNTLLDRYAKGGSASVPTPKLPPPKQISHSQPMTQAGPAFHTLQILKDFSAVLTHSLSTEGMCRQFLIALRGVLGVNRAALFFRAPEPQQGAAPAQSSGLRSIAAIGVAPGILDHLQLSVDSGIGRLIASQIRILRRESSEVANDSELQKEFEVLGAQVAIPMFIRERLSGVLMIDSRLTGEPLANTELELIFHLLEELGLALGNINLHEQLASNNAMLTNVLRELSSACIVVNRDLAVVHANKVARSIFAKAARRGAELEFADIPAALASKVYQVLNTGTGIATFRWEGEHPQEAAAAAYHVSIVPMQEPGAAQPNAVLLVVEDHSKEEQLQHLEIETANLRLVKTMADRLAHEIGNALVPLSTHQQLLADKYKDPEFRASLESALAESVKRISRLTSQMRYLARDSIISKEALPLAQLLEESFQEAQKYQPLKSAHLKLDKREQPIVLAGDRAALKHAVTEVLLNALQANPSDANVEVHTRLDTSSTGSSWVHIDIQDNGPGFSPEAMKKVPSPFFTTRNVGLGLGLAVTRKILETHRGKLEVIDGTKDKPNIVRISLPLEQRQRASA